MAEIPGNRIVWKQLLTSLRSRRGRPTPKHSDARKPGVSDRYSYEPISCTYTTLYALELFQQTKCKEKRKTVAIDNSRLSSVDSNGFCDFERCALKRKRSTTKLAHFVSSEPTYSDWTLNSLKTGKCLLLWTDCTSATDVLLAEKHSASASCAESANI